MAVDPTVRRSILQVLYVRRKAEEVRTPAVAEELDLDLELVEGYLDVMEEEGLVNVSRRYGGGHGVELTSRGLLEARSPGDEAPAEAGAPETALKGQPSMAKTRQRLQEQLERLEELEPRARDESLEEAEKWKTLDEIHRWEKWTEAVVRRGYGDNSRELSEFRAKMGSHWPGPVPPNLATYRWRFPEWRSLLSTWIREIDEFGVEGAAAAGRTGEGRHADAGTMDETQTEYFVAHEFSRAEVDDLRKAIAKALAGSGLRAYYADNEVREGHIFRDKILPKIGATRFGIYDLSNPEKPNVFMELGAAMGMGKSYFIICRRGTKLPSDVQGLDRIEYDSYSHLTRELKAKISGGSGQPP